MRTDYFVSPATVELQRAALHNNLGVYHPQYGAGIGGFFSGIMKKLIPLGKSLLKHGYEAAKPELQKLAHKGVDYLGKRAAQELDSGLKKAKKKIGERDSLS